MPTDIAVTGLGLVTPAGFTPEDNWATLCAGRSLAAADPVLHGLPVDFSCQVTGLDAEAELGRLTRRLDDFIQFALVAARRAVRDAALDPHTWRAERVGVVLGVGGTSLTAYEKAFQHLSTGHPDRVSPLSVPRSNPNMAAGEVAIDLGARGPNFSVSTACASGATAIGVARDLLRSGTCDIVLAGGTESARSRMTAACFARMRALSRRRDQPHLASRPFDSARDGFVLGEGAAVLVLEPLTAARSRGASVQALLRGFGSSADAHHPIAPHPEGRGVIQAVTTALQDAGCRPQDIGHINAHGTSTPTNDTVEAAALTRIFGDQPPPVTAPKGVIGHSLGAAGAIEAAYTVLALRHASIPPVANFAFQDGDHKLDIVAASPRPLTMGTGISCSFGFGGQNAVLLFEAA
ncbi:MULTISPECIES: beta-ketoacyl-[acyl-carrier-protein] synthase family protein [unclassified Streptomyces]|uniref:beta-ketoacyl-[acyl-carrier-protein] synthase family protein n=1 Tax=unclassified Streptomyces TaxID=2593676 RepID=UPI002E764522|nr:MULTISPECIES: beta-ketoacyl-[acyl-carrier-protein] synthase family protein [unclassified Streptomyces]MEE1757547.1 beta-ketoacyl-[acyl-carrier-protein] synthase family protein [Streptomyces sp. SP18BB07]MEE1831219.1 beta-ketoacyl-[acyl-carrier-protein] synthase family protein [Streptomyces sp. SP17KL33]